MIMRRTLEGGDLLRYQSFFSATGKEAANQLSWCAACDVSRQHSLTNCDSYLGSRPSGLVCSWEPCPPPNVVLPHGRVCAPPYPSGQPLNVVALRCENNPIMLWDMRTRLGLCLLAGGLAACEAAPCDHVLQEEKVYSAVVLASYSTGGVYPGPDPVARGADSCAGFDGMTEGTSVGLKMVGRTDGESCRPALGMLEQVPPAVTISKPGQPTGATSVLLKGVGMTTLNGCSGWYSLGYYRVQGAQDPFAVPVPGQTPPLVLLRGFQPSSDAGAGCKSCQDYFVVQLQRPVQ